MFHGAIAPSASESSSSGTRSSGSTSIFVPRPAQVGAGAVGRVEREGAGLEVVHRELVAVGAGHLLGEAPLAVRVVLVEIHEVEHEDALGQPQRRLHRVGEPLLRARLHREPVDDDRDVVLLLLLQRRRLGQRIDRAVDQDAGVALALELGEQVDVLALAPADDRREHLEPAARLHLEHLVDDLLRGLLGDDLAAGGAVRRAGAGVEQPQVVVDLGDGADGGPRVAAGGLLVDRDGGRQALDEVDVGLVHLPEELAGVRRERLDVAPLALREDGVERQAGLPRPGEAGEDDEAVARQVDVDAREVVLTGALDDEAVGHGSAPQDSSAGRASALHTPGHRQRCRIRVVRTCLTGVSSDVTSHHRQRPPGPDPGDGRHIPHGGPHARPSVGTDHGAVNGRAGRPRG